MWRDSNGPADQGCEACAGAAPTLPRPSPALGQHAPASTKVGTALRLRRSLTVTETCKILVVEDQPDLRMLLGNALEHEGYRILWAKDARKARKALERGSPDLVLTDITLPGGEDGFAVARLAEEQGVGVILVSGRHDLEPRMRESGFGYLLKPFRIRDLLRLVARRLEGAGKSGRLPPGLRQYGV